MVRSILHILSGLYGVAAFTLLGFVSNLRPEGNPLSLVAALALLSAAAVGLIVAGRDNRGQTIAAYIILLGAAIFASMISLRAFAIENSVDQFAPVGGVLMPIGWLTLALFRPKAA